MSAKDCYSPTCLTLNFTTMKLYQFNNVVVKETDQTPDPLFNPNEITRVKDILDLHKRGMSVAVSSSLRGSFDDDRSDYAKLSSPNMESDKLFPSIPRLVAQNAHYKSSLEQRKIELEKAKELEDFKSKMNIETSSNADV